MAIYKFSSEILSVSVGKRAVAFIAKGLHLIWQSVRSCFGAGHWRDDKPWKDDECWKD